MSVKVSVFGVLAVLFCLLGAAIPAQAQTGAQGGSSGSEGAQGGGARIGTLGTASAGVPAAAAAALNALKLSRSYCGQVPEEYRIDCIASFFASAAAALPQSGRYSAMRQVLEGTAQRLDQLVEANLDQSRPAIRIQAGPGGATSPRLRAVAPAAVPAASAAAARIVAEAETRLLRSADAQSEAKLEYLQVAEAVGSNKVLLRS